MTRRSIPLIALLVSATLLTDPVLADTPPEEEAAIKAIRGRASNIQKNRDGTVRFVRFSKKIVTDEHVAHVSAFQNLDYLAVVTPSVTDTGLAAVKGLTNLDTLYLSKSGVTDAGLSVVTGLSKLERLYLDQTAVTDAGLQHVSSVASLTTLALRDTAITDDGLRHVAGLQNLEVLFLSGTQVTDAGLQRLSGLTKLKTLYLERTAIDGSGLKSLASLEHLETLSLSDTQVSGKSLHALIACKGLKQLLLHKTPAGNSSESLEEVEAARPGLAIITSPQAGRERNPLQRYLAGEPLRGPLGEAPTTDAANQSGAGDAAGDVLGPASDRFTDGDEIPDFQQHVIPLLGRLGCNGRTCHGAFQGQGGFRLSMFGYDFKADIEALTGGDEPRVNVKAPDKSLILRKPTTDDDHGGGQRFQPGDWEHQLLRRWIAGGANGVTSTRSTGQPGSPTETTAEPQTIARFEISPAEIVFTKPDETRQLKAIAIWSDGTREDVTCLTRFQTNDDTIAEVTSDGLVRCKSPGDTHVISFYDNGIFSTPILLPVSDKTGDRFPVVPTPTPIDRFVVEKLSKLGIVPSETCSDEEFLRRVSLDMTGTLPSAAELDAFVTDTSADKRSRKIDELLESPAYVEWWTMRLADLTGSNAQYLGSTDMNRPAAEQWVAWLRRRVKDNVSWDRIAAGLILSESRRPGQSYEDYVQEQSAFLSRVDPQDYTAHDNPMHYYWFRSNNQQPTDRALSFGYIFLGVRLQCAQCHKHPFDQWSKQDFEQFTQFFSRIKAGVAPSAREAQNQLKMKLGVPKKLDTAALRRQMYMRVAAEGLPIPWNEIWIEPAGDKPQIARLLADDTLDLSEYDDPREPLMAWLVQKDNPYFARAFVNRIWAHYFGIGIVDPPDDFNMANPPSNRPLLDWLSMQFVEHGYDIKWLHGAIARSRTYQLSWRPNETNVNDERNFSHAIIRRLPAEVTVDAILRATASDAKAATFHSTMQGRKIGMHPVSIQTRSIDYSLLVFGKPLRTTNCDCERQLQPTLLQSLYVRNDHELIEWLERKDGWLAQLAKTLGQSLVSDLKPRTETEPPDAGEAPAPERLDELIQAAYLRTQNRSPSADELSRARSHIAETESTVEGLRDLMWALLNTQEFLTNH